MRTLHAIVPALLLLAASAARAADENCSDHPSAEPEEAAAAASLAQALQADSGVFVTTVCTNCNNADLAMGGLSNDHVPVSCDGLPVPPGLAQIYLLSIVPPAMIDRVVVTRGAGSAALGGAAVGGGIDISRRASQTDGAWLDLSVDAGGDGWSGTRLSATGRRGRVGGEAIASWASSDRVDANDDGSPELPSFDRYTVEAHGDVSLAGRQTLRLGGMRYRESQQDGPAAFDLRTFDRTGEMHDNREDVELTRDQLDLVYRVSLPDGSEVRLAGLAADRAQEVAETQQWDAPDGFPTYFIDERLRHGSAAWSRPWGDRVLARAGASWDRRDTGVIDVLYNLRRNLSQHVPLEEALRLSLEQDAHEWTTERGVWLETDVAATPRLSLTAGARWIDLTARDQEDRPAWRAMPLPQGDRIVPRAAATWKPLDSLMLRLSAGAGFRAPDPIFEEVCCGRRYRNNRGVRVERSRAVGLEATWQPSARLRLGGTLFVTDFEDLVVKLVSVSYQWAPTYQHTNVPRARTSSAGLDARWELASWITAKAAVSWLRPENRTEGDAIPILVDAFGTPVSITMHEGTIPYIARRAASLSLEMRPSSRATVALITQHTGSMRIQSFDRTTPQPPLASDAIGFASTPAFWTLNASASWALGRGLGLFVGVDNATDYVETDLGLPWFDHDWGPLRGRYVYGGLSYRLGD